MMNLTAWSKDLTKTDLRLCTAFNFGYTGVLAMSQISLVTDKHDHPPANMDQGIRSARRCSIVIISGKFISEIEAVMDVIQDISEDTIMMPLAVFLMEGPDPEPEPMTFNISSRSHYSPLMVSILCLFIVDARHDLLGFCSLL